MDQVQGMLPNILRSNAQVQSTPKTKTTLDYIALLPRLLPPTIYNPLLNIVTTTFALLRTLSSHFAPVVTRLLTAPDIPTVLLLIALLLISLKVLDMAYRAVLFWVNLAFKLL